MVDQKTAWYASVSTSGRDIYCSLQYISVPGITSNTLLCLCHTLGQEIELGEKQEESSKAVLNSVPDQADANSSEY